METILYAIIVDNLIQSVFPWDGKSPLGPAIIIPGNSTIMPLEQAQQQGYSFPEMPIYVPDYIESYQLRDWLIVHNKKETVESIINNIPDPLERERVRNRWEYATKIPRNHILVKMIANVLKMTEEQIDYAFIDAAVSVNNVI